MAILTYIDGAPLYSTINEALGLEKGILENVKGVSGYHVHRYKNVIGYMTGADHSQRYEVNILQQQRKQEQQMLEQVSRRNTSSGQTTQQTTQSTGFAQPSTGYIAGDESGYPEGRGGE